MFLATVDLPEVGFEALAEDSAEIEYLEAAQGAVLAASET